MMFTLACSCESVVYNRQARVQVQNTHSALSKQALRLWNECHDPYMI